MRQQDRVSATGKDSWISENNTNGKHEDDEYIPVMLIQFWIWKNRGREMEPKDSRGTQLPAGGINMTWPKMWVPFCSTVTCSRPSTVATSLLSSTPTYNGSFLRDIFARSSTFRVCVAENSMVCLRSEREEVISNLNWMEVSLQLWESEHIL